MQFLSTTLPFDKVYALIGMDFNSGTNYSYGISSSHGIDSKMESILSAIGNGIGIWTSISWKSM